jgi:hypothetical protein
VVVGEKIQILIEVEAVLNQPNQAAPDPRPET